MSLFVSAFYAKRPYLLVRYMHSRGGGTGRSGCIAKALRQCLHAVEGLFAVAVIRADLPVVVPDEGAPNADEWPDGGSGLSLVQRQPGGHRAMQLSMLARCNAVIYRLHGIWLTYITCNLSKYTRK